MTARKENEIAPNRRPLSVLRRGDPFTRLREEMDEVFSHYFSPTARGLVSDDNGFGMPTSLDLSETDKNITVTLDAPGIEEKDLDIALTDGGLLISGQRELEREEAEESFHRIERSYGSFQRLVPLPCEVKADKVSAELKKGVLKISLPKSDKARQTTHKIAIKAG